MTFPSTYFDIDTCVRRTTQAALDLRKRVRQASLDVLAVLGQITSPKAIIDIVISVSRHRKESEQLIAAVKTRLARKQLPIVSVDGSIQYALRLPSSQQNIELTVFGADIDYICAGIGSASPTSIKRCTTKLQQPQLLSNQQKSYYHNGSFRYNIRNINYY